MSGDGSKYDNALWPTAPADLGDDEEIDDDENSPANLVNYFMYAIIFRYLMSL